MVIIVAKQCIINVIVIHHAQNHQTENLNHVLRTARHVLDVFRQLIIVDAMLYVERAGTLLQQCRSKTRMVLFHMVTQILDADLIKRHVLIRSLILTVRSGNKQKDITTHITRTKLQLISHYPQEFLLHF